MKRAVPRALLSLLLVAGCKRTNDSYCCTLADACVDGVMRSCGDPERPFCDNFGEFPDSDGVARTCIASPGPPCVDGQCGDPALSVCLDGICVGCGVSADCSFTSPVCDPIAHTCGACGDSSDCGGFADRPICSGGACIGCMGPDDCTPAAPICDPNDQVCRGCGAHDECDSQVCDLSDGSCIDNADVLYVAVDGTGNDCTQSAPCGSIQDAVDLAGATRVWILVAAGSYTGNVTVSGKTIHIVAGGADLAPGALQVPLVKVTAGGHLTIEGLRIHDEGGGGDDDGIACDVSGGASTLSLRSVVVDGNAGRGVDSDGCAVDATTSEIRGNTGFGLYATGGSLSIDRSSVVGNLGGGIHADACDFTILNDFIARNGNGSAVTSGVEILHGPPSGAAAGRLEHDTIVGNVGSTSPSGLTCSLVGTALVFRNDILSGNNAGDAQAAGANCAFRYSVIKPLLAGEGNLAGPPAFVAADDYHLASESPGIDVGEASDVTIDFDGDARPLGDGPDIGADEVVP